MNLKQALERIEALERRVKELEARPPVQQNYHYHYETGPAFPHYPIWSPNTQPTWGTTC